jgi:putative membrane protein
MELAILTTLCLSRPEAPAAGLAWMQLNIAPAVALPLLALLLLHVRVLRQRRATGRVIAAAAAGHLLLAVALISPLCRLAAVLASAHMVQHIILVGIAPPLLVAGGLRIPGSRALLLPALGYTAAIWAWHIPAWYEAALLSATLHVAMLATLLGVGLWFWGAVLRARLEALPTLLLMLMQTGMLGALLTFAKAPLYPLVAAGAAALGRAPLADQQLAGLLMWVPMALIFLAAALWQTARALAPSAAQAARLRA